MSLWMQALLTFVFIFVGFLLIYWLHKIEKI